MSGPELEPLVLTLAGRGWRRWWWCGPWQRFPGGGTHWSRRELAARAGVSPASVQRIWRASGRQPWRAGTFKISPDPLLIGKIRDAAGLYLAPPANAAVFSVDEKPRIQAPERTAPVLPMPPGVPGRRSFDDVRHATADLPAAPDIAAGKGHRQAAGPAPGGGLPRLPGPDRPPDRSWPGAPRDLRQPLRPQSAGGAPLAAGPPPLRAALHSCVLILGFSQAGRWLAELQRRCLNPGVFCPVDELTRAPEDRIRLRNESARPSKWTKTADQITDRICRYCSHISRPAH